MSTPAMAVDMRHTKLNAADAALIAGEIVKPSWASKNEGIHERISFDDTLWGFELAGGAFYKTPIRVVDVRPGSRADQANIRKGDKVLRINGIDTSTLTLQEAHDIVVESGIHLKIAVTSPDDEEDAYYTYEDALAEESRLAEELRKAMEAERIRRALARAQRSCNLPWPWVRRKMIVYRESNCFLVPSKYEGKHKELFPELPHVRYTEEICELHNTAKELNETKPKENGLRASSEEKGEPVSINEDVASVMDEKEQNEIIDQILKEEDEDLPTHNDTSSDVETDHSEMNGELVGPDNEEDALEYIKEDDEEENRIGNENSDNEILEDAEDKTNDDIEYKIPSVSIENEDVEDEILNVVSEDKVNEEDTVVKTEEDNVVDSIVGGNEHDSDFNDSINER